MRDPNVTSLYFITPLVFNAPMKGFPWDHLRKILRGGQRMTRIPNVEEILPKASTPRVRRWAHERYRRQANDRSICNSKYTGTYNVVTFG